MEHPTPQPRRQRLTCRWCRNEDREIIMHPPRPMIIGRAAIERLMAAEKEEPTLSMCARKDCGVCACEAHAAQYFMQISDESPHYCVTCYIRFRQASGKQGS